MEINYGDVDGLHSVISGVWVLKMHSVVCSSQLGCSMRF